MFYYLNGTVAEIAERYGLTDLRLFAVVGIGLERVVWQAITPVGPTMKPALPIRPRVSGPISPRTPGSRKTPSATSSAAPSPLAVGWVAQPSGSAAMPTSSSRRRRASVSGSGMGLGIAHFPSTSRFRFASPLW